MPFVNNNSLNQPLPRNDFEINNETTFAAREQIQVYKLVLTVSCGKIVRESVKLK
jgi:hypothetical protein